jgi:hypothetical protein
MVLVTNGIEPHVACGLQVSTRLIILLCIQQYDKLNRMW